jgi:hypothetical protein
MWKKFKKWRERKQALRQFRKFNEYHAQQAKAFGAWVGSQSPSKFMEVKNVETN